MTHLLQMASKVEALTAVNWRVDQEIFAVIHGWSYPLHGAALAEFDQASLETGLTNPTRSIDAALSLLPKASLWSVCDMEDGPYAQVIRPMPDGGYINGLTTGRAATPALAMCAAVLRALAGSSAQPATPGSQS